MRVDRTAEKISSERGTPELARVARRSVSAWQGQHIRRIRGSCTVTHGPQIVDNPRVQVEIVVNRPLAVRVDRLPVQQQSRLCERNSLTDSIRPATRCSRRRQAADHCNGPGTSQVATTPSATTSRMAPTDRRSLPLQGRCRLRYVKIARSSCRPSRLRPRRCGPLPRLRASASKVETLIDHVTRVA